MNRKTFGTRSHRTSFVILTVLAILGTLPHCATAAFVQGVILTKGGPLAGGNVRAYKTLRDTWGGTPFAASSPGTKTGFYRLELPPGKYYLVAGGTGNGREYSSFHGGNPVIVDTKNLWLSFMLNPVTSPVVKAAERTRLTGMVTFRGKPVANAQVSLYLPANGAFKGMGLLGSSTVEDGSFSFNMLPGDYLVVARKRLSDKGGMPLRKGDLFCYAAGNPVMAKDNVETNIEIPCYPVNDVNAFLDEGVQVKKKRVEMPPGTPPPQEKTFGDSLQSENGTVH